jgi:hypothetical protein
MYGRRVARDHSTCTSRRHEGVTWPPETETEMPTCDGVEALPLGDRRAMSPRGGQCRLCAVSPRSGAFADGSAAIEMLVGATLTDAGRKRRNIARGKSKRIARRGQRAR